MNLRVYLENIGRYVEGKPVGSWFNLPIKEEEVAERLHLDENHEEFLVFDFDGFPSGMTRSEYFSINELNEIYRMLSELEEQFGEMVPDLFEVTFNNVNEVYEYMNNIIVYPDQTLEDVAYDLVHKQVTKDVPEWILRYFDYEAYAKDLSFDNFTKTTHGVVEIC